LYISLLLSGGAQSEKSIDEFRIDVIVLVFACLERLGYFNKTSQAFCFGKILS
jgi:hypothetical protein